MRCRPRREGLFDGLSEKDAARLRAMLDQLAPTPGVRGSIMFPLTPVTVSDPMPTEIPEPPRRKKGKRV